MIFCGKVFLIIHITLLLIHRSPSAGVSFYGGGGSFVGGSTVGGVLDGVGVNVIVDVGVADRVGVGVIVGVDVMEGVSDWVGVGVTVGVSVAVDVCDWVGVKVGIRVAVALTQRQIATEDEHIATITMKIMTNPVPIPMPHSNLDLFPTIGVDIIGLVTTFFLMTAVCATLSGDCILGFETGIAFVFGYVGARFCCIGAVEVANFSSTAANFRISAYLSAGSRANAFDKRRKSPLGTSAGQVEGSSTGWKCFAITAGGVEPLNRRLPVSISTSTAASAYWSAAVVIGLSSQISGGIYSGVPITTPLCVLRLLSPSAFTSPKSDNTAPSLGSMRIFCGLTSR